MYRFALRMTGSAWAAEEIVQDVFHDFDARTEEIRFEKPRNVGGYLYGIARNRVMKHLERLPREVLWNKKRDGSGAGIVLQDAATPATWAEARER